jgi:superfamily II RNA helicase
MFDGNLVRSMLKVSNLVEELKTLAVMSEDVELLDKLQYLQPKIVRDVAVPDSLYLKL